MDDEIFTQKDAARSEQNHVDVSVMPMNLQDYSKTSEAHSKRGNNNKHSPRNQFGQKL